MGISGVFKRGKREDKFVGMLIEQTQITVEGLKLLEKWLGKTELKEKAIDQMRSKEIEADEVRRILIDELHNTFITPLDREDIFMISLYIDDILDYCYSTVEEMQLLGIEADEYLMKMVTLTREATEELEMAFHLQQSPCRRRTCPPGEKDRKRSGTSVSGSHRRSICQSQRL